MKYLLTATLIFITSFASAQIVNIPDPYFKNQLLTYQPVIDVNFDGEIQVSEALAVTSLTNIDATDITGIKAFANLDTLYCFKVPNLDVSNMTHLRKLSVFSVTNSFNVSGCNNLESLELLNIYPDIFTDVTISLPRLKTIYCNSGIMGNMILTGSDSLRKITFGETYIKTLDISGLTQLDTIKNFGGFDRLIARNCTGLKSIQRDIYSSNGSILDELDVTGCTNLDRISLQEAEFPNLDLSTCTNLRILYITGFANYLRNINFKNGRQLDSLYFNNMDTPTPPLNVCADEFEIDSLRHMITRNYNFMQNPRFVSINSYCSFYPAGVYNTINGNIKLDLNNNGCDNNDAGMPGVPVKFTDTSGQSTTRFSSTSGEYDVETFKGLFTIQPFFPYAYFITTPATSTVSFDTVNNIIATRNFCIRPNGVHNDLEITFLPIGGARPGFNSSYRMVYKNRGTTVLSGSVQLNFDNSKMTLVYTSIPVSNQTTGQLTWNYNNLLPFESKTILIWFNLSPPPVNNINDTLTFLATINPIAGDETAYDNSFTLPQRVIGSFDPNDKQCLEGSRIAFEDIDKSLHYIIHFQNLGTDTAFNIVVADTLSNKLDWNSVELISSSHTCDVKQTNNKLEFFFRDIKLPYKAIDDEGSNGFVAFKVKPKSTVTIGDSLNNRAGIYFDFNLPVMTNLSTTIVSLVPPIPVKLEYFSGSKKDEKNILTWKAPSTNGSTTFNTERSGDGINFSSIGNIIASTERCQLPFNFTDNIPLPGKNYYRLKITDADRKTFYSKIILLENSKTGIDILSVLSSKENTTVYLNSSTKQIVQLKIIAVDGKVISYENKMIGQGNNKIDVKSARIAPGVYTLILYTNAGEFTTKRFIK